MGTAVPLYRAPILRHFKRPTEPDSLRIAAVNALLDVSLTRIV